MYALYSYSTDMRYEKILLCNLTLGITYSIDYLNLPATITHAYPLSIGRSPSFFTLQLDMQFIVKVALKNVCL